MKRSASIPSTILLVAASLLTGSVTPRGATTAPQAPQATVPQFQVDPFWPKPLPKNWILGDVSGIAVDSRDHVWIVHRPGTITEKDGPPPTSVCCVPAPPVIEFDADGNVVQGWGGSAGFEWLGREHGISVDPDGNVWVTGSRDHLVAKFTSAGKFLLQIGRRNMTGGNNDVATLGGPTQTRVDRDANEVFVADGEGGNRRMIVFDATTGAYKRRWNAYGSTTTEGRSPRYDPAAAPSREFGGSVHCVRFSRDGLVYVCDRENNRIQVFKKDGMFVSELVIAKEVVLVGSIWDIDLSLDQQFLYVADGANHKVWIVRRNPLSVVGSFGSPGRNAGQFLWPNTIATDSKGNVFTGEVTSGNRVQKFIPKSR